MARKISQLPALPSVGSGAVLPVVQGGVTYALPAKVDASNQHAIANLHYVDARHHGAMVTSDIDAAAANRATINAAVVAANAASVALTGPCRVLLPAGFYYIAGTIALLSNVTLEGAGMGATTLYAAAEHYTNTTIGTHDSTSLAIEASGLRTNPYTQARNIAVKNLTLEFEVEDGRCLYGIRCDNVRNPLIENVEVKGLPVGNCIELNSVRGGAVRGCWLHDCTTALDTYGATPQLNGIELDNVKINSVVSVGLAIRDNYIEDLTFTGSALSTYGFQTDGINLQNGSAIRTDDNFISNVGEGIDSFASDGFITRNALFDCYHAGIKLIHGASRNDCGFNKIVRPGRSGFSLSGVTANSTYNYIHDSTIHDVNVNGVWNAQSNAALHVLSGGGFEANNNTFRNNKVTGGSNMDYVIRNEAGTGNRYYDTEPQSWLVAYSSISGGTAEIVNVSGFGITQAYTIAGGVITLQGDLGGVPILVDTEAAAADDDLDTINGGRIGQTIVVMAADNARDVTLKDGTGNLRLEADRDLDTATDTCTLRWDGSAWRELAFANNA